MLVWSEGPPRQTEIKREGEEARKRGRAKEGRAGRRKAKYIIQTKRVRVVNDAENPKRNEGEIRRRHGPKETSGAATTQGRWSSGWQTRTKAPTS